MKIKFLTRRKHRRMIRQGWPYFYAKQGTFERHLWLLSRAWRKLGKAFEEADLRFRKYYD